MERGGYWEQFTVIKQQLQTIMESVQSQLAHLKGGIVEKADKARSPEELRSEINELNNLKSQLLAVWSRLETFIALIEQKEVALQGIASKAVA